MSSFLEQFHRQHGTVHDFLMKELGMTLDQIHAVRDALSVEIPIPHAVL